MGVNRKYQILTRLQKNSIILAEFDEVEKSMNGYYPTAWAKLYNGRTNDELDTLIEKVAFLKEVLLEKARKGSMAYNQSDYSYDMGTLSKLHEWFLQQKTNF